MDTNNDQTEDLSDRIKSISEKSFPNDYTDKSPCKSKTTQKIFHDFYKTELCPEYSKGKCFRGGSCNYAHSMEELRAKPNFQRTKLCLSYIEGKCTKSADDCKFAHSEHDLRSTPNMYKTSLCYKYKQGICQLGDKCRFAHGAIELRPSDYRAFNTKPKNFTPGGKTSRRPVQFKSSNVLTSPISSPPGSSQYLYTQGFPHSIQYPVYPPSMVLINTIPSFAFLDQDPLSSLNPERFKKEFSESELTPN